MPLSALSEVVGLANHVTVDFDRIRDLIPEAPLLKFADPARWGYSSQQESRPRAPPEQQESEHTTLCDTACSGEQTF